MKTRHLLPLLLLPLLLAGCERQRTFNAAEKQFRKNAQIETMLLDGIHESYFRATSKQIEHLHRGYMRDGTFALLDSIDVEQHRLIAVMMKNCNRRSVQRLADCYVHHFNTARRITDAEIPFVYKKFPPPGVFPDFEPIRCR